MDPIANFLAILRNAQNARKERATVPFSKEKFEIAKILKKEGFVERAEMKGVKAKKCIEVGLRYVDGEPAISGTKRVSKPGQRIYHGYRDMKPVKGGRGVSIVSTSQGVMLDKEAKRRKLGGEVICSIW